LISPYYMFRLCYSTIFSWNLLLKTKIELYVQHEIYESELIELIYNLWYFIPSMLNFSTLRSFDALYKVYRLILLTHFYESCIINMVQP
jgi:hypothetical protein